MSIIRLVDQWIVIHNFSSSDWLPASPYHFDQMYGLKWLYEIIILQISLAVMMSFGSLFILVREGGQKYSWRYKTAFFFSIIILIVVAIIQAGDMNSMLARIRATFLANYISDIDEITPFSATANSSILLQQVLLTGKISYLSTLPASIPIPTWLTNIIGIRLLLLVFEVYGIVARLLGWKRIPKPIGDILKKLT